MKVDAAATRARSGPMPVSRHGRVQEDTGPIETPFQLKNRNNRQNIAFTQICIENYFGFFLHF